MRGRRGLFARFREVRMGMARAERGLGDFISGIVTLPASPGEEDEDGGTERRRR